MTQTAFVIHANDDAVMVVLGDQYQASTECAKLERADFEAYAKSHPGRFATLADYRSRLHWSVSVVPVLVGAAREVA